MPAEVLSPKNEEKDVLAEELFEIDALLARSSRLLAGFFAPSPADGQETDAAGQGTTAGDVADARSENLFLTR